MNLETCNMYLARAMRYVISDVRITLGIAIVMLALRWTRPKKRIEALNRNVFITGCDSGMGHRMARRLDEMGMRVFAGCLQPQGKGAQSLKESCSQRLCIVPLDITEEDQVRNAVNYVKLQLNIGAKQRGLHYLINNAGVLAYTSFQLMTAKMCEEVVNINLLGTMRVTKHFLPIISENRGRIVTITSILARLAIPDVTVYTATKHALDGFFTALRYEVLNRGIQVAMVEPGDFSTCTDIMQWTQRHLDEIWANLSPEEKESQLHLYEKTKARVAKQKCSPSEQENTYKCLLGDVEDALLSEEPQFRYVSAPFFARVAIWLLRNMPETWMVKYFHKLL